MSTLELMPARHVGDTDKVVGQVLRSQSMQRSENQHHQLELYALRRAQPVKADEHHSEALSTDWRRRHREAGIPIRVTDEGRAFQTVGAT